MLETNAKGAEPSMNDGLIKYSGSFINTDAYGNGNKREYTIQTSIRSNIVVFTESKGLNEISGEYDINIDNVLVEYSVIDYVYYVTLHIPSGCKCFYRISGSENTVDTLIEQEKYSNAHDLDTMDWNHGHNHDGDNSGKVSYADLLGAPSIPEGSYTTHIPFKWNGTPATYDYDLNYGADGINLPPPNSPATCKLKGIMYNCNDGANNYNAGYLSLTSQVGGDVVAGTDRFSLRWYEDGGDFFKIYKNGVAYIDLSALAIPQPQYGNSVYQLIFEYTASPV